MLQNISVIRHQTPVNSSTSVYLFVLLTTFMFSRPCLNFSPDPDSGSRSGLDVNVCYSVPLFCWCQNSLRLVSNGSSVLTGGGARKHKYNRKVMGWISDRSDWFWCSSLLIILSWFGLFLFLFLNEQRLGLRVSPGPRRLGLIHVTLKRSVGPQKSSGFLFSVLPSKRDQKSLCYVPQQKRIICFLS